MNDDIGILILAAGSSSRMGTSKQLLEIDGKSLLVRTVNIAIASLIKNIIVVLGSEEIAHRSVIHDLPVKIIHNTNWSSGMGSSLKAGFNAFQTENIAKSIIVLVCDQPMLTSDLLQKMIRLYRSADRGIIACRYRDTVGVPVLFSSHYFNAIQNLNDDQGAKGLIYSNAHDMLAIDFPEGAIDLDTPEDLEKFKNR